MATELDLMTSRPIGKWRLTPPDVVVAENGYVLRTYDAMTDQTRYQIAATADDVGIALRQWADSVAADIRAAVERQLAKVA